MNSNTNWVTTNLGNLTEDDLEETNLAYVIRPLYRRRAITSL